LAEGSGVYNTCLITWATSPAPLPSLHIASTRHPTPCAGLFLPSRPICPASSQRPLLRPPLHGAILGPTHPHLTPSARTMKTRGLFPPPTSIDSTGLCLPPPSAVRTMQTRRCLATTPSAMIACRQPPPSLGNFIYW
jgi:hypothetical protein